MTVEPSEPSGDPEQGAALESSSTSPFRLLFVIVPLLVIVAAGTNLLGLWMTSAQQAQREERLREAESEQKRRLSERQQAEPKDQSSSKFESTLPDIRKLLKRLRPQRDEEAAGNLPANPTPGADHDPEPAAARQEPSLEDTIFNAPAVVARLANANLQDGARIFRMCGACHAETKDGPNRLGPSLWGIVGREKASRADYRYSEVLKAKGGTWSYEELAKYIHDPRGYAPGTSMTFRGIADNGKMANLIAYLRTLSDKPAPLPK
jgi:cytochrome c